MPSGSRTSGQIPAWVKAAIDERTTAAGITEGRIFRAVRKRGKVWGQDLTLSLQNRICWGLLPGRW